MQLWRWSLITTKFYARIEDIHASKNPPLLVLLYAENEFDSSQTEDTTSNALGFQQRSKQAKETVPRIRRPTDWLTDMRKIQSIGRSTFHCHVCGCYLAQSLSSSRFMHSQLDHRRNFSKLSGLGSFFSSPSTCLSVYFCLSVCWLATRATGRETKMNKKQD